MEQWTGIKEAVALTQKPERTLRWNAARGKILGKKDGQNWLIELNSLRKAGFLKLDLSQELRGSPGEAKGGRQAPSPVSGASASSVPSTGEEPKSKTPHDLACYRNLVEWRAVAAKECPSCLPLSSEILKKLAAGYFEFSRERKAESYHQARDGLAHLWVELDLRRTEESDPAGAVAKLADRLRADVIPALSGALRKIERAAAKTCEGRDE